jgi:hypothetical protein
MSGIAFKLGTDIESSCNCPAETTRINRKKELIKNFSYSKSL